MTNIFIGDAVTTLQKATLIPGGNDALIYSTISGAVGVLVPLNSREVPLRSSKTVEIK